ncbi:LysE family transporter [Campylobacter sp. US33a]|uniref:LysE family transporter n=1 Tax=Campylobacter sp. CCS1377 TaxID=3158229 RepID=A0AAU7EAT4_9BACT|nr:LysE family transporter [Campylobacter sp. US33a]MCW1361108.1 LysE family translocator [Campylobacter jejuni]TEY02347.1 lysine transporter LysE [Campylobacter sp. US33a]
MFESLLNGIILGLGVCVPFGPVNILILTYALTSFKNAFSVGLGAMLADVIYLLLLNFGILKFLNNEFFLKILAVFGFCFLSYIAFLTLKAKAKNLELRGKSVKENIGKSFFKGLMLNITNPYIIGFWLSVATLSASNAYPLAMAFGLIFIIFIWVFSLSFFVGKYSYLFSAKVIFLINVVSAIIIEYFALNLLYRTFIG